MLKVWLKSHFNRQRNNVGRCSQRNPRTPMWGVYGIALDQKTMSSQNLPTPCQKKKSKEERTKNTTTHPKFSSALNCGARLAQTQEPDPNKCLNKLVTTPVVGFHPITGHQPIVRFLLPIIKSWGCRCGRKFHSNSTQVETVNVFRFRENPTPLFFFRSWAKNNNNRFF